MDIHQCSFCSYKSERLSNFERHRLRKRIRIVAPPQVVGAVNSSQCQNMDEEGFGIDEYEGDEDFFLGQLLMDQRLRVKVKEILGVLIKFMI